MGSFVFAFLLHKYPSKIEGFVEVAGAVDMWYVGLMTFYNVTVISNGLNKPGVDLQRLAQDE